MLLSVQPTSTARCRLAARAADVAEFCRINHEVQRDLGAHFGLSFDHFGRTSNIANHELTQHLAERLDAEGYIEERVIRQIYSHTDGRFLPDRYIEGTCPYCGYEKARGDQCENCTRQLEPTMLVDPRSAISGSTDLEERESRHLYLLQSKLAERLRPWLESKVGEWPTLATSIGLKWLDEGLEDRGITRDLDWGIPVNHPGFENKVFYVWFDAPIGYIAATREWAEAAPEGERDWESWWRTDRGADDVWYTEFMAKDNVPFHTLGFPATLMGSGEPWRLVDQLKSFNWLNYYGGKFSTSDHRGVFMTDASELLPADYWRWYSSPTPRERRHEFHVGPVRRGGQQGPRRHARQLRQPVLTQVDRHFDGLVPAGGEVGEIEAALVDRIAALIEEYRTHFDGLEFRKATRSLREIWAEGNVYLEAREPWRAIKVDRDAAAVTLRTALGLARVFGHLSAPFVPETSERIAALLPEASGLDGVDPSLAASILELAPGSPFVSSGLLFQKIDDDTLAAWAGRFGGAVRTAAEPKIRTAVEPKIRTAAEWPTPRIDAAGGGRATTVTAMATRSARAKRLRSKESPPAQGRSRSSRRARALAGNATRLLVLVAIVLGSGALAGMALGYPIGSLDLGSSDAITLDQEALAGTIDAEQALVAQGDIPKSYTPADENVTAGVALIGAKYCGVTVAPEAVVGEPITRAYLDSTNHALMLSEVVKVRQQNEAGKYIKELTGVFDGCSDQKYFTGDGADKVRLQISNPRKKDEPLELDYLTRTLTPVNGGTTQIVTYFQVGNVIVAIQYAGPDKPDNNLMTNAEYEILYRVAPDQFSKTAKDKGEKPCPTRPRRRRPPTWCSRLHVSPPTIATTPPTFEAPTTTRAKRTTTT